MQDFENRPPEENREEEKKTYYYSQQSDGSFQESTPPIPEKKGDGLAIASLTLGLIGLLCCGWSTGIAALICALVDRSRRGKLEGMGLAGFILGIISTVMGLISTAYSIIVLGSLYAIIEEILRESGELLSLFRFF
jgi:hypothetical protein